MFRNFKLLVAALIAVTLALPAAARGPDKNWVLLGEQKVGFRVDRDAINVGDSGARFSELRIVAENNDVHLINLRLVYQNGYAEDLKVDQMLRAGGEALPVDLKGERSFLKQIEMTYRSRPSFDGRAVVKVYGELRGRSFGGPDRPVAGGNFETIDTQRVGRDDDGTAVFDLGRRDGRFSAIRFAAVDGGIRIRSVRVTYGNGETQTVDVGDRLDEGEQTKVIDLEGDRRFIRRVEVQARTRRSTRGPAGITLLARKDTEYRGGGRDRDDRADRGRDRDERGDRGRDRDDNVFERGRKEEWVTLGVQKANMLGADTDVFNVGREAGLFKAIRVVVEKQDVRFLGMTIVYGNGEREDVPLSGVVRKGETSQPFDLKGRERFIESVSFTYRAKLSLKGSARVTVQGLQHGWFRRR